MFRKFLWFKTNLSWLIPVVLSRQNAVRSWWMPNVHKSYTSWNSQSPYDWQFQKLISSVCLSLLESNFYDFTGIWPRHLIIFSKVACFRSVRSCQGFEPSAPPILPFLHLFFHFLSCKLCICFTSHTTGLDFSRQKLAWLLLNELPALQFKGPHMSYQLQILHASSRRQRFWATSFMNVIILTDAGSKRSERDWL